MVYTDLTPLSISEILECRFIVFQLINKVHDVELCF